MTGCDFCKKVSTDEDYDKPDRVQRTDLKLATRLGTHLFTRSFDLCEKCANALAVHMADAVQKTKETRKEEARGTSP